ncbi:hypothetical protein [Saccharopolyspora cebuensis]|uniref:Uncharacterized protein n=1 Tax=Saccharopolyspora cebuensis TaxID=418759 RepID=A0ABV4CJW7_9PSEU
MAEQSAAARYKELTALATAAGKFQRRHEQVKAVELGEVVAQGRQRIEESEAHRDEVVAEVRKRWNAAMEALWDERWFRGEGMPAPDRDAPAAPGEESVRMVQLAFLGLHEALGKTSRFSRRNRR